MGGLRRTAVFNGVVYVFIERRWFRRRYCFLLLWIASGTQYGAHHQKAQYPYVHWILAASGQAITNALSFPSIRARKVFPLWAFLSEIMSPCLPCVSATAGTWREAAPAIAVTSTKSPRSTWNGSIKSARSTG